MPKVTVISDNELQERLITDLLLARGYELVSHHPDLVILKSADIFPTIQRLYKTPIILVSARVPQLQQHYETQDIKPDAYLSIPFGFQEFYNILKSPAISDGASCQDARRRF